MTNITELAQRMKAAAVRAKTATEEYASGHMSVSVCFAECEEFNRLTDGPDNIIALVDALEKAQGMEAYWKTQCRGITDHCEELQARIAELESRTVKLPESFKLAKSSSGLRYYYADEVDAALTAAGIKVEAE
ncbi:hypothetical protein [Klebsiella pneumoniae]|uniref:hypothetical protein n=1 Tax=Klebsiella pneumoniae TaxID=573 RepID=UPI0003BF3562|nr:hypothetical protein [Klebsiella pneumoniae]HDS8420258.1 hypothetical protein [Klebsiella pneumoniae subsp. pneumoniae]ESN51629.1 hypothetical protein L364_02130 [Klebsiella pneumoniae MGH 18]MBK2925935.1 hypothetical protein [Klebsiella pneumoniae]MBK2941832.1 hypothetical protein [Klebsiella pneumoniae]MBK2947019.1 hypothetical protein [Klebsiella pneumoniae]